MDLRAKAAAGGAVAKVSSLAVYDDRWMTLPEKTIKLFSFLSGAVE